MSLTAERSELQLAPSAEYDKPKEACAVIGIRAKGERVAHLARAGLEAMQHRGQEGAGIDTVTAAGPLFYKSLGLVQQVFHEPEILRQLEGDYKNSPAYVAIGHTRYSTTGENALGNLGPFRRDIVSSAHNGNLTNARFLRSLLESFGFQAESTTDSELITGSIAHASGSTPEEKVIMASHLWEGAYSLVISVGDILFGVRDPSGFRPLCIGRLNGSGWIVASETVALEQVGADFVREVGQGEICMFSDSGCETIHYIHPRFNESDRRGGLCVFEYIYLSHAGSVLKNIFVNRARFRLGQALARKEFAEVDLVIDIPDNGRPFAIGYSRASGIPYDEGVLRNRYFGLRTFIQPDHNLRLRGAERKYHLLRGVLDGMRIAVTDDSIVRGVTTQRLVHELFKMGAREVHLRIGSDRIQNPCPFGVDMATHKELAAYNRTLEEIRDFTGATSLVYLSVEEMVDAIGVSEREVCTGCFTGAYPEPVDEPIDKFSLEKMASAVSR